MKLKKLPQYALLAISLLLAIALVRNLIKIRSSGERTVGALEKLEKAKDENSQLKAELEEVQSQVFIEKQARDKLGLAKEGEIVLVLPDEDVLRSLSPRSERIEEFIFQPPVWRQWVNLFL